MFLIALLACRTDKDLSDSVDTGERVDVDQDGAFANEDCDDLNNAVFPGNVEVPYNGLDDDCDEATLDDDLDGDGTLGAWDCDDSDPEVNPEAIEACNGVDDDCNGEVDDAIGDTWYEDEDGDGFGDETEATQSCEPGDDTVAQAGDCDDRDAAVNPDATEVCNTVDDNCDGQVDEGVQSTFYADADGDGSGDAHSSVDACEAPSGTVEDDRDCDDTEASVNPHATEICNSIDDDCDGHTDEDDAADALTWFHDDDGDGYGDPTDSTEACEQPSDYVDDDTDCDDTEADAWPGNTETWYDGVDSDCGGDDDYDADGDGETPYAYGGTDCDDTDASVNQAAANCRATCTPPSTTTLATYDPSGVTDLQFDDDCVAWVSTVISGTDYVYSIDSSGTTTVYSGASNHDIGSVAVDPSGSGSFAVSYNNVGYFGVVSGSSIPVLTTGGYRKGSNWSNQYLNNNASSMAWDSSGCIWLPNFSAKGSLDCFSSSGGYTTLATLADYVESVALDADETLYASVDATVYQVDSQGTATTWFTFNEPVLDMVLDLTGEAYVLTDLGVILLVDSTGTTSSTYASVSGEGKLAISPDGTLYYVQSQPVSPAVYSSWSL